MENENIIQKRLTLLSYGLLQNAKIHGAIQETKPSNDKKGRQKVFFLNFFNFEVLELLLFLALTIKNCVLMIHSCLSVMGLCNSEM